MYTSSKMDGQEQDRMLRLPDSIYHAVRIHSVTTRRKMRDLAIDAFACWALTHRATEVEQAIKNYRKENE